MDQDQGHYIYKQLTDPSHIRILVLEDGDVDEPLRCQLVETALGSEDLQYMGNVSGRRDIFCEDHRLSITTNLHSALVRIRQIWAPVPGELHLWADGICINQSAEPHWLRERAGQVQPMVRFTRKQKELLSTLETRIQTLPWRSILQRKYIICQDARTWPATNRRASAQTNSKTWDSLDGGNEKDIPRHSDLRR